MSFLEGCLGEVIARVVFGILFFPLFALICTPYILVAALRGPARYGYEVRFRYGNLWRRYREVVFI